MFLIYVYIIMPSLVIKRLAGIECVMGEGTYWPLTRAESAIAFSRLHPEAAKAMNPVNPVNPVRKCL